MDGQYFSLEETSRLSVLSEENIMQKEIARKTARSQTSIKKSAPVDPRPASWHGSSAWKRAWTTGVEIDNDRQATKRERNNDTIFYIVRTWKGALNSISECIREDYSPSPTKWTRSPSRHAALNPMLTQKMKKKRLSFHKKYKNWIIKQWTRVIFSDESNFKCIQGTLGRVRRRPGSKRCDPRVTTKTVKHPDFVMIFSAPIGKMSRAGLHFLHKNETRIGSKYIGNLEPHMLPFYQIHVCKFFPARFSSVSYFKTC